ncbi:MAG: hypothetical protein U9N11_02460 [Campylobacterota bacterium]|nr:hypothetical protein [Campylobacterota bacterium]
MKFTKLSLIATLAMSAAFAGGDIAPTEAEVTTPVAAADCEKDTTIAGKAVGYYYSVEGSEDLFDKKNSQIGTAVTLDVAHKLTSNITANFSAVGYANLGEEEAGYMEGQETGAFMNVANLTGTFGDTTVVVGRQLLDTPMLGSFDWLLAPSAFEAATIVNTSISNVTLVGSYVNKWRGNNSGSTFAELTDDNYAVGAAYSDAFDASVWYYNVDALDYTQVYADAGYTFSGITLNAQYVTTDYASTDDSTAFGVKIGGEFAGMTASVAYNKIEDAAAGMVGVDSLYTSSWNVFASGIVDDSFKVALGTELAGFATEVSYAQYGEEGSALDVVLGYDITNTLNLGVVFTATDYTYDDASDDAENALEVFATYTF